MERYGDEMTVSTWQRGGRQASITSEAVTRAAVEIVDALGFDALSLRNLAKALGVSHMAVHRASGGVDAIRDRVVTDLINHTEIGRQWPDDWEGILRTFATFLRDLLVQHPAVFEAHRRAPLVAPGALEIAERAVAAIVSTGIPLSNAVPAYMTLHDFVTGHVALLLARPAQPTPPPDTPALTHIAAARELFLHPDREARFRAGVDLIIDGIRASATR